MIALQYLGYYTVQRGARCCCCCCSDVGGSVATTVPEEEGSVLVASPPLRIEGSDSDPCSGSERHHAELISTSATQRGRGRE